MALVHGDVHDKHTLQTLNYIFPCHLTVRRAQGCNICSGIWRKTSGKITDTVKKQIPELILCEKTKSFLCSGRILQHYR